MRWMRFLLLLLPVALGTLFAAFWATILLVPLWRWIEEDYGIEAIGHSGPAEWCFYAVFAVLMLPALWMLWRACRPPPAPWE